MLGWTTGRGGAPSERALSIPSGTGGLRPDAFITVEALELVADGRPGSPRIETHIPTSHALCECYWLKCRQRIHILSAVLCEGWLKRHQLSLTSVTVARSPFVRYFCVCLPGMG